MNTINIIGILLLAFLASCNRSSEGSAEAAKLITHTVTANLETEPLKNRSVNDDAADDPAIWINHATPDESRIIGTDKKGGLAVYNLKGEELFFYSDGKMNNVDIRYNFPLKSGNIDLVACSNRSSHGVSFYKINTNGSLTKIRCNLKSKMRDEVYGFCLAKDIKSGFYYALINSKSGEVEQWILQSEREEQIRAVLARNFKIKSKTEGIVAHDELGQLFIGEEEGGIWLTEINHNSNVTPYLLRESVPEKNTKIKADIEGITFYKNYLIASSQGNYSYAVFQLQKPHKYITSFRVVDGKVDGAEETDGIDAVAYGLGDQFPEGIFVVQDGFNRDAGKLKTQNFKIIDWRKIQKVIDQ